MDSLFKKAMSNIALCAEPDKPLYMLEVAKILKKKNNSKIWLYCSDQDQKNYYTKIIDRNIISGISIIPSVSSGLILNNNIKNMSEDSLIKEANFYEKKLGVTISHLILSNRHLGRGFAIAGTRHPRSHYSEEINYIDSLKIYIAILKFWEKEFIEKSISLVLNGGKEIAVLSRAHNIMFRCITETKIDNLNFWGWNEYRNSPHLEHHYHSELNEDLLSKENSLIKKTNVYTALNKNKFFKEISLYKLPSLICERILRQVWWTIKGKQKSKGYYLKEMIKLFLNRALEWRILNNLVNVNIRELEGKKFVYYPLHVEPEVALQTMSPEFYFQHALIVSIAANLPAGIKLVVKEAFGAVGRRPPTFYKQIRDLKNVLLADPKEAGVDYAMNAHITVTITGTAGFEAAVNGNSVITLGQHNNYNIMPNVYMVKNFNEINNLLKDLLSLEYGYKHSLLGGKRYIRALKKIAFDFSDYNFLNFKNFSTDSVNGCASKLEESILFQLKNVNMKKL